MKIAENSLERQSCYLSSTMSFFETVISIDTSLLERPKIAFSHLPDSIHLGNQKYSFEHFSPDPEKSELCGTSEAAINQELEMTFATKGQRGNSPPYRFEFGEPISGLVNNHLMHKK
jgi:hypothetical protein